MTREQIRDWLILPVALVTMAGWLASLVVAVLDNQLGPLTAVTPIMLMLAGYVFGANIVRVVARGREGNGPDEQ